MNFADSGAFVVRESPAGRVIFETLKDGQPHRMLLAIQFRKDAQNILGHPEDCVWITRVISDRPYQYDESMASRLTSPILLARSQPEVQEIPFSVSAIEGCWVRGGESTGGERLIVPGLRLRITATKHAIKELKLKIVYQEKRKDGVEILDEDTEYVVGGLSSPDPLEKGFSKEIISHSGRGYSDSSVVADIIAKHDVQAVVSFDLGDGYVKLRTVPIAKVIGQ